MEFKKLTKIIHTAVSILTAISAILLFLSFKFSFDALNGYFTDALLPVLFKLTFALGILLSLSTIPMQSKNKIIKTENLAGKFSKAYITIALILVLCSLGANFLFAHKLFSIMIASTCSFAIFIISCAGKRGYQYSHAKLLLLLASIAFPVIANLDNSRVLYRHSNSVENSLTSVFTIAFLIYILYEGNRLFKGVHSRWHFASMLLLTHAGFALSSAYIAAYLTYSVNEKFRFYEMILIFIISVFVEIELIRFVKCAASRTQAEWDEVEREHESEHQEEYSVENMEEAEKTNDAEQ